MVPNNGEAQRYLVKYRVKKVPDFRIFNAKGKVVLEDASKLTDARKAIGGKK